MPKSLCDHAPEPPGHPQHRNSDEEEGNVDHHVPHVLEGDEYPVGVVLSPWGEALSLTEDKGSLDESELTRVVHDKNRDAMIVNATPIRLSN
ncbi:MAG TPA: hypothetical protein VIQ76_16785 [Propionibacteriaceae bacterium]